MIQFNGGQCLRLKAVHASLPWWSIFKVEGGECLMPKVGQCLVPMSVRFTATSTMDCKC